MPVLSSNIDVKRIILKESSKPNDEAWVDIVGQVLMEHVYDVDLGGDQQVVTVQVLSKTIKAWNFTNEEGTGLPITPENIKLLPLLDIAQISHESGLEQKFASLSNQKKSPSSAI